MKTIPGLALAALLLAGCEDAARTCQESGGEYRVTGSHYGIVGQSYNAKTGTTFVYGTVAEYGCVMPR